MKCPVQPPHKIHADARGILAHIHDSDNFSVLYVTSKKDTIRANHYHKKGEHYCYIIKGLVLYTWREVGNILTNSVLVKEGEIIYTPPMVEHLFEFLEDSEFITISPHTREQSSYEDDLIRVELKDDSPLL